MYVIFNSVLILYIHIPGFKPIFADPKPRKRDDDYDDLLLPPSRGGYGGGGGGGGGGHRMDGGGYSSGYNDRGIITKELLEFHLFLFQLNSYTKKA